MIPKARLLEVLPRLQDLRRQFVRRLVAQGGVLENPIDVADGGLSAEEAVRAYHGELQKLGIPPRRSLQDDL